MICVSVRISTVTSVVIGFTLRCDSAVVLGLQGALILDTLGLPTAQFADIAVHGDEEDSKVLPEPCGREPRRMMVGITRSHYLGSNRI